MYQNLCLLHPCLRAFAIWRKENWRVLIENFFFFFCHRWRLVFRDLTGISWEIDTLPFISQLVPKSEFQGFPSMRGDNVVNKLALKFCEEAALSSTYDFFFFFLFSFNLSCNVMHFEGKTRQNGRDVWLRKLSKCKSQIQYLCNYCEQWIGARALNNLAKTNHVSLVLCHCEQYFSSHYTSATFIGGPTVECNLPVQTHDSVGT